MQRASAIEAAALSIRRAHIEEETTGKWLRNTRLRPSNPRLDFRESGAKKFSLERSRVNNCRSKSEIDVVSRPWHNGMHQTDERVKGNALANMLQ
jgi:hypothetical protein